MRQRFLYFIPGVTGCSMELLHKLGLASRFVTAEKTLGEWCCRQWEAGPNNLNGVLIAQGQRPPEYNPVDQTWIESPGYWVGLETPAMPPGPSDLTRGTHLAGYEIVLGDRHAWHCPRIWKWNRAINDHENMLPQKLSRRIEDGRVRLGREIVPGYRPLQKITERAWKAFTEKQSLSWEALFEDAVALLSVNYTVGLEEAELLGLFNEDLLLQVLKAAIDQPGIAAHIDDLSAGGLVAFDEASSDQDPFQSPAADKKPENEEVTGG